MLNALSKTQDKFSERNLANFCKRIHQGQVVKLHGLSSSTLAATSGFPLEGSPDFSVADEENASRTEQIQKVQTKMRPDYL